MKRKPLPYHAIEALDHAQMELIEALRIQRSLMDGQPITGEEKYRRIGLTIDKIYRASEWLKQIRTKHEGDKV